MELIELKGLFEIDYGAPSPMILSNDSELFVSFYADKIGGFSKPRERNTVYDTGIIGLKFKTYLKYTFGLPGNETIEGHPYSKLGMRSSSFYVLKNSRLLRELQEIEKVHTYYDAKRWDAYRHYILTFHDNMFECIAQGFEIREENTSLYNQAISMLNELSANQF